MQFVALCDSCLQSSLSDPLKAATLREYWDGGSPIRKAEAPEGYGGLNQAQGLGDYMPFNFVTPQRPQLPAPLPAEPAKSRFYFETPYPTAGYKAVRRKRAV